ncbi:MAG: DUF4331 family protein [Fimbriimonas sp.]
MHSKFKFGLCALGAVGLLGALVVPAIGSDHADTQENVGNPGQDISDVYIFPSKENPNNVVFVMNVNPLIARGGTARFDPQVLYQFKIDTNKDNVEDLVIQAKFDSEANQGVRIAGPVKPSSLGTTSNLERFQTVAGTVGTTFQPAPGMRVFAGTREDSFFFDLERFFTIFPDRGVPTGLTTPPENPNQPMATSWRPAGEARDFLSAGGYNVLSIVVEVPKSMVQEQ